MKRNVLEQAADYNKQRRKKVRRYKVLSVLAAFVVFCTTYSLIMPAITMEHPQCGLEEHTHGTGCYEQKLVCTLEESEGSGHVHTDDCYTVTTEKELTCGQAEGGHTHDDSCYTVETVTKYKTVTEDITETVTVEDTETRDVTDEEGNVIGSETVVTGSHEETNVIGTREVQVEDGTEEVKTLTCGQSEGSHTHDDSCYTETEKRELTCTESDGGHKHSDSCYEKVLVCEIPEHHHDDSCYPAKDEGDKSDSSSDSSSADASEPETPDVEYETDEDGNVVLDEESNPVPKKPAAIGDENKDLTNGILGDLLDKINAGLTDEEGYLIDENGERVLDENGEPIKVQRTGVAVLPDGAAVPAGYNVEYNCKNEDSGVAVTVYATKDAFPADYYGEDLERLELVAEVLDESSTEYEDAASALDPESFDGMVAMDIRFEIDGVEVEPMDRVYVVINAQGVLPEDADPESIAIQHIEENTEAGIMTLDVEEEEPAAASDVNAVTVADVADETDGVVKVEGDVDVAAAFEVESFSTFAITYYSTNSVTVYVVDELGNQINGRTQNVALGYHRDEFATTSGITIERLLELYPDLVSFEDSNFKYTVSRVVKGDITNLVVGFNGRETEILRIRYQQSRIQYSKNASGDSWNNVGNSDKWFFVYTKEFTGDTSGYIDDGLAYNNGAGTSNGGLYQSGYDSTKQVWWDTGITGDQYNIRYIDRHVKLVTLTPSDYLGSALEGYTAVEVPMGNARTNPPEPDGEGKKLSELFVASAGSGSVNYDMYVECEKSEATYIKVSNKYYEKDSATWKQLYEDLDPERGEVFYRRYVNGDYYGYSKLQITPEPGYYVTKVEVACLNSSVAHPFNCARHGEGVALTAYFDLSSGMNPTLTIRSDAFSHDDDKGVSGDGYYILIETAAIPSPLYVKYDAGKIGDQDATNIIGTDAAQWLYSEGNRHTKTESVNQSSATVDKLIKTGKDEDNNSVWANGDLTYYPAGITDSAKEAARAQGYRFTGWKLEYYDEVEEDQNNIENTQFTKKSSSTDSNLKQPGVATNLVINAKLIAQWEPVPVAEVVKTVTGQEGDDLAAIKTYTFEVKMENTNANSFTVKRQHYVANGGIVVPVEETITVPFTEGKGSFNVEIRGNNSYGCAISGIPDGTYTVTETNNGGAQRTTYSGHDLNVVNAPAGETQTTTSVTVTNDFSPLPATFDLDLEKVTKDGDKAHPETADGSEVWSALGGATFGIYKPESEVDRFEDLDTDGYQQKAIAILRPTKNGATAHTIVTDTLSYGQMYKLVELNAAPGYNQLDHAIYFTVETDGTFKLRTVNGDNSYSDIDREKDEYVSGSLTTANDKTVLKLIVANYGGYVLPSTGGAGTLVYTLGGGMLMMACALVLVYKKSLRKEGREF